MEQDSADHPRPRRAKVISGSAPETQPLSESLYGQGGRTALQGLDSECSVTVQYEDDGTTAVVSAAEKPRSQLEVYTEYAVLGAYAALAFWPGGGSRSWEAAEERHEELLEEMAELASGGKLPQAPLSGEYWGASEESDAGDQAVRTTLRFRRDGVIEGHGVDGVDGAYRVKKGVWGARDGKDDDVTLGWIEEYDAGFRVVVKGRYDRRDGQIKASFTSSRGVSGWVDLAPKPSVF